MSVRKRKWKTAKGIEKVAWITAYADRAGDRHIETFQRKMDADDRHAEIKGEVKRGTHTAASKSISVEAGASKWLEACEAAGLERATLNTYGQHVRRHIVPYLGGVKLSLLTTGTIRDFQDDLRKGTMEPACPRRPI